MDKNKITLILKKRRIKLTKVIFNHLNKFKKHKIDCPIIILEVKIKIIIQISLINKQIKYLEIYNIIQFKTINNKIKNYNNFLIKKRFQLNIQEKTAIKR
jgi:hypothetical protein